MMEPVSVAFLLFPGLTQLDLTGPAQLLSRLGNVKLDLVWKDRVPVPTDAGFSIVATAAFDEVNKADILCIPGGVGVADVMEDEQAMAWVRRIGAQAQWVTSVCTGSLILGAAGLLKGYRATSHWAWRDQLRCSAPNRSTSGWCSTAIASPAARRRGHRFRASADRARIRGESMRNAAARLRI